MISKLEIRNTKSTSSDQYTSMCDAMHLDQEILSVKLTF